jgi:membrane-bound metal-dependent hydrolase YbcI (DUF457 family)
MPSPIGHALAGAAIAWTVAPGRTGSLDALSPRTAPSRPRVPSATPLLWACVALAAAPDLDLLAPYTHRTITHSFAAVAVVAIVSIAVTGKVTRRIAPLMVLACTLAYASHLALDWMAVDDSVPRGVQLLWPFDDRWFISGWDLFRGTARRDIFTALSMRTNALAILQELAILGPIAWLAHRRLRTRSGTSVDAFPA